MPPTDDGASPAPIDRAILEYVQHRLATTGQIASAAVADDGHRELRAEFADEYYPERVASAVLTVRWYANDDFAIHYRERHADGEWECRWDRHPNPHNSREHYHPPPDAATPAEDATWPTDHRAVLQLVLEEIEARVETLWTGR